jgi:hypothetical protein
VANLQLSEPRAIEDAQQSMNRYLAQQSCSLAEPRPELAVPTASEARGAPSGDQPAPSSGRDDGVLLTVDGVVLRPVDRYVEKYSFVVPRNARSVWLRSRPLRSAPGQAGAGDPGLKVRQITLRYEAAEVVIPPDDPRLEMGWHDVERAGAAMWRRTRETAEVPWTMVPEPVVVTVHRMPSAEAHPEPVESGASSATVAASTLAVPAIMASPQIATGPVRLQWCVGMYSSGSTWAFNAIRCVGGIVLASGPRTGVYVEAAEALPADWFNSDALVIKSHHPDEAVSALLQRHADRIWIMIRDPRDAVASASTYIFPDFDSALDMVEQSALNCERLMRDRGASVLRYEDGFIDDPAMLDRFAEAFGGSLTPVERDELFQQTRRSAIETMIRGLSVDQTVDDGYRGHRVHLETQWHTHHMNRTGEIGRWHDSLDHDQLAEIDRRLGAWMKRFGYNT